MRIVVSLSGALRVVAGTARIELSLEGDRTTLADALDAIVTRYPLARRYLGDASRAVAAGVRVLLNDTRLGDEPPETVMLRDGDRLALLMPVMGG